MVKCSYGWHKVRFKYSIMLLYYYYIILLYSSFFSQIQPSATIEVEGIKIFLNCLKTALKKLKMMSVQS